MKSKAVVSLVFLLALCSWAGAAVIYETGFDPNDDASGSNYAIDDLYGQNGWTQVGIYGSASVINGWNHNSSGVMELSAAVDSGVSRASGINTSLTDYPDSAEIKISMTVAVPVTSGQFDMVIECGFGTIMTWRKYSDGSGPFSHASLTTAGDFTWGSPVGDDIWAGGWSWSTSPYSFNSSPWPYLETTANYDYRTQLEITIWNTATETKIQYYALTPGYTTGYTDGDGGFPGVNEVTSQIITFASKVSDLRTFGDLILKGTTPGFAFPLYVDKVKIEYGEHVAPVSPYPAGVTYQTGFDQTDDSSDDDYTAGDLYGQNGWTPIGSNGSAAVENDWFPHEGDGVMQLSAGVGSGISRASGIDGNLSDGGDDAEITISMTIGTVDVANQGDLIIECGFGTIMTWRKYAKAGSGPFSHASLTTAGAWTWASPVGADIWAGGWSGSDYFNSAIWPYLNTTATDDFRTQLEIKIWNTATETKIQYHALTSGYVGLIGGLPPTDGVGNNFDGNNEVTSQEITLAAKVDDLRTFGNITFKGLTPGYTFPLYVDDLKIEYSDGSGPLVCGDPGTVYLDSDINEDCSVDLGDVAELASEWLHCTDPGISTCDQYWR